MIVAAGTLVLLGLAMFVAGLATGVTAFFWGCVAVCVVAAVLLVLARRHMRAAPDGGPDERVAVPATAVVAAATSERAAAAGTTQDRPPDAVRRTDELPAVPPTARPADDEPTAEQPAIEPVEEPPAETSYYRALAESSAAAAAVSTDGPPHAAAGASEAGEPPLEDVEVTDLLLIVDLKDEVLVVDEHPRYHLPGCSHVAGQETIPIPLDEARTDGFTPCGICRPDGTLAERERTHRHR